MAYIFIIICMSKLVSNLSKIFLCIAWQQKATVYCTHQYDSNGVHASPYQIWHETYLLNELSLAIEQTISSTINYCSLSLCLTMKAWTNAILLNKCNDMTFVTTLQNFNSIWAALKIISLLICNHFSRKVVLEKVVLQTRIFFLIGDPEKNPSLQNHFSPAWKNGGFIV